MAVPPQVVVIEDDAATRRALGRVLRAAGFEPHAFASAEEYLGTPSGPRPVCLVLDVGLAAVSGIDLLRHLRGAGSDLPVIVMTALDDDELRAEADRLGCVTYLLKDSDSGELLGILRALVAARR